MNNLFLDAPKFECNRRVSAFPGSGNFTIQCSVHSNPALEITNVHWSFEGTGINNSVVQNNIYSGDSIDIFTADGRVSICKLKKITILRSFLLLELS